MEVKTYEDIEKMFKDLEEQRKLAIEAFNNCTEKQKALKEGDVFVTIVYDLVILNKIQKLDPEDEKEFEHAKSMGYVFVKAWSNAVPEGETGSVHRSRALFQIIDSKKYKAERIIDTFLAIWESGEMISMDDLRWVDEDGCVVKL